MGNPFGSESDMSRIDLDSKTLQASYFHKSNKVFFLLGKNHRSKYGKNRKNNNSNKIQDLEKEEAMKGLEKFANIANIAKLTRISLAS